MNFKLLLAFAISFYSSALLGQVKRLVITFASDTQEPMWVETLFLKSNHNLEATKAIFKDIDTLRPSALFILGDIVSLGKSKSAWKHIDKYIKQTTRDSIKVYATLGNHEVMFNTKKGTKNFKTRFPDYNPTGFTKIIDSVAVILLNSNFSTMSVAEITAQNNWYHDKIKALDTDSAVKIIIVGCHHSPYTNSTIVTPSVPVQDNFVPPFLASKKGLLFISGHSHNFEQFKVKGKHFLVIGGGGGLHQPLRANNEKMHDLSSDYKPAFHYLEVIRVHSAITVISRRLKTDMSGFDDGLTLTYN